MSSDSQVLSQRNSKIIKYRAARTVSDPTAEGKRVSASMVTTRRLLTHLTRSADSKSLLSSGEEDSDESNAGGEEHFGWDEMWCSRSRSEETICARRGSLPCPQLNPRAFIHCYLVRGGQRKARQDMTAVRLAPHFFRLELNILLPTFRLQGTLTMRSRTYQPPLFFKSLDNFFLLSHSVSLAFVWYCFC